MTGETKFCVYLAFQMGTMVARHIGTEKEGFLDRMMDCLHAIADDDLTLIESGTDLRQEDHEAADLTERRLQNQEMQKAIAIIVYQDLSKQLEGDDDWERL